jgi:hypothetical protein
MHEGEWKQWQEMQLLQAAAVAATRRLIASSFVVTSSVWLQTIMVMLILSILGWTNV